MSDLGPLVATVLRDRAVLEMMAEMKKLKSLVDDRLKVQITGKKGSPVYFEGSLKDGYTSHRGRCFEVMFHDDDTDGDDADSTASTSTENSSSRLRLPLSAFIDIEVRLGGVTIQRLGLQDVVGSCNTPFFTNDDFYRDAKYNKPAYLEPDRKEIILKVKTRHKGPVPFIVAHFEDELDLEKYRKLHVLDMADLKSLAKSKNNYALILDGLSFTKHEIANSLSVLEEMGYTVDEDNSHCRFANPYEKVKMPRAEREQPAPRRTTQPIQGRSIRTTSTSKR